MDDKDLIAVMAHVVTTLEEKTKQTILQPPVTVTATAAEGATSTATATVNSTTAANSTTTTPEAIAVITKKFFIFH